MQCCCEQSSRTWGCTNNCEYENSHNLILIDVIYKSDKKSFYAITLNIQSDSFYTANRTEDLRSLIDYIHYQYPEAPLFAVGTSVGANILVLLENNVIYFDILHVWLFHIIEVVTVSNGFFQVKYLGEDGVNVPIVGAAAICSPWDSLVSTL